ncbi:hypothetical protein HPB47_018623 [Ixodes persulcatus]|uniref:Uncharacterized protein n=2 Tax=Ixodes persulcatus TaxID=34615 RepID=A0AC60QMJ2_IXOPE|nr:hypothetical protein HPB47_000173 [Ixodes persulcatus]KAG0435200.1 hypothetical protein HPB47_018623 [Ixodes persulcatus]
MSFAVSQGSGGSNERVQEIYIRSGTPGATSDSKTPGKTNSRIEVSTVNAGPDNQIGGNLTVYGGGQYRIKTTISDEMANYQITDESGQVRNITVPTTKSPHAGKYERRVIVENGVETVEEYQNDQLFKRTVDGVEQPLTK